MSRRFIIEIIKFSIKANVYGGIFYLTLFSISNIFLVILETLIILKESKIDVLKAI